MRRLAWSVVALLAACGSSTSNPDEPSNINGGAGTESAGNSGVGGDSNPASGGNNGTGTGGNNSTGTSGTSNPGTGGGNAGGGTGGAKNPADASVVIPLSDAAGAPSEAGPPRYYGDGGVTAVAATPPAQWVNVTADLAGMASECGNTSHMSSHPNRDEIIVSVAQKGLWATTDGGTSWHKLGTGQ